MIPMLWAVFIVGPPPGLAIPLHHMPPRLHSTQAACEAEIPDDLEHVITIVDPGYHLECQTVASYLGSPA